MPVPEPSEPEQGETEADEIEAAAEAGPLYRDKRTARFAAGERVKEFQGFEEQAKKRLVILNASVTRNGLAMLPSNRFEALKRRPQRAVQHPHQSAMASVL